MILGFYRLGLQNPTVRTTFGGMYQSFFDAIAMNKGWTAKLITYEDEVNSCDVLIVPMGDGQEQASCRAMQRFTGPVILYVQPAHNWFKAGLLKRWKKKILFVYSTDVSSYSKKQYRSLGIQHIHLPFGSDQTIFRPLRTEKIFDIAFVANATSGHGREKYIAPLLQLVKKKGWRIALIGSGWEKFGFPYQVIAHGPLLNLLYNSSKVCINISNSEQVLGEDVCLDANNRLFDVALAGCCQVSNGSKLVKHYFDPSEVLTADTPQNWLKLVEECLHDPKLRQSLSKQAHKKAVKIHTWRHRAHVLIDSINKLKQEKETASSVSLFNVGRLADLYSPPVDYYYKIGKQLSAKLLA